MQHHHNIENIESLDHGEDEEGAENDSHELFEGDEDDSEEEEEEEEDGNEDNAEEASYHNDEYVKEEDADAVDESNEVELGEWAESSTPSNPPSEYEHAAISHESEAVNQLDRGYSGGERENNFAESHHDARQHFGSDYQAHSSFPSSISSAASLTQARSRMVGITDATSNDGSDDSSELIPPGANRLISSSRARAHQSSSMQSPTEWFHSSATPRVAQQSGPPYVDSSDSSRRASEQSYDGIGSLMRSTHERPPTNAANDRPRKRVKKEEGTQDSLPAVKSPTDKEEVVSRHNSSPVPDDSHILDSG